MMPATSLTLVVILVALFATPTLQQPNPIPKIMDVYCLRRGAGNYTEGSPYQLNLKTLLSALDSNSSSASFYQTSVAEGSNNTVYGRYYCRHDLSLPVCSSCVQAATKQIVSGCPTFKEAIVWFEQCTLLYLTSSTRLDTIDLASPYIILGNQKNVTDPGAYAPVLQATINRVINESAYGPGSEGFGTEEGKVSKFETLYSLAQCSPDRVGGLCDRCLRKALREVDSCCSEHVHVAFFYPNCQLRFGVLGPFYDVTNSPPVASPPPPITQASKDPAQPTPAGNWAIGRMSNNGLNLGIFMALSTLMLLGN